MTLKIAFQASSLVTLIGGLLLGHNSSVCLAVAGILAILAVSA